MLKVEIVRRILRLELPCVPKPVCTNRGYAYLGADCVVDTVCFFDVLPAVLKSPPNRESR